MKRSLDCTFISIAFFFTFSIGATTEYTFAKPPKILSVSPTGTHALIASCDKTVLVDLVNNRDLLFLRAKPSIHSAQAGFSPDGNSAFLSQTELGTILFSIKKDLVTNKQLSTTALTTCSFDHDSDFFIGADEQNTVGIWKVSNARLIHRETIDEEYKRISFSPDAKTLVCMTAGKDSIRRVKIAHLKKNRQRPLQVLRHALAFGLSTGIFLFTSITQQNDPAGKIAGNAAMSASVSVLSTYIVAGAILSSRSLRIVRDETLASVDQLLARNISRLEKSSIGKFLDDLTNTPKESAVVEMTGD